MWPEFFTVRSRKRAALSGSDKGVIVGKGAACSGSKRGNRVLSEMGLNTAESERCLRISLSADTDAEQAVQAAEIITECAKAIRSGHLG